MGTMGKVHGIRVGHMLDLRVKHMGFLWETRLITLNCSLELPLANTWRPFVCFDKQVDNVKSM